MRILDFNDVQRLGYKNFLVYNIEAINNINDAGNSCHDYYILKGPQDGFLPYDTCYCISAFEEM